MLKVLKIAVTGGLACGKSSICAFLKELGAYILSADEIVHQLLFSDINLGKEIVALLGEDVQGSQGLDREAIAEKVFKDPQLLKRLEELVHPVVLREIKREAEKTKVPLFVVEIPLLFETGAEKYFDYTVVVVADEQRCHGRSSFDDEEYDRRMARQWKIEEKRKKADYVIENNGSLEELQEQALKFHQRLLQS